MSSLAAMMSKQRDARLARDAQKATETARRMHRTSAPNFWDNVNTSGGVDACHPWEGATRYNHPAGVLSRYEEAVFEGYEGSDTRYAQRIACFAVYGRLVPKDMDVSPICGDHLCMNVRHFAIVKHGGRGPKRDVTAVPAEEYFRCDVVDVLRKGGYEVVEGADNVLKMIKDAA
jgi:hypothetical protein